jgi:LmbE family N-acetylglucosaminyl deacetylase
MKFNNIGAEIYIPDGVSEEVALSRTTHLAISAHQDDIEIMACDGILKCFGKKDEWFLGAVVSNGAGSPRGGLYAEYSDNEMMAVRKAEQKKEAAQIENEVKQLLAED